MKIQSSESTLPAPLPPSPARKTFPSRSQPSQLAQIAETVAKVACPILAALGLIALIAAVFFLVVASHGAGAVLIPIFGKTAAGALIGVAKTAGPIVCYAVAGLAGLGILSAVSAISLEEANITK